MTADQPSGEHDSLIIDAVMPEFDVTIVESIVVRAEPAQVFATARALDFMTVRTPLLVAAMWVRDAPRRYLGAEAGVPPPKLVLGEGMGLPGWLVLGEAPGHEIAFGAVGKFWQPQIEWRDVGQTEFSAFAEPGYGKIACSFSVRAYGTRAALLTYECRTSTTDPNAREKFARYWRLIRPFVAHIMRATVRTIRDDAEQP